MGVIIYLDTFLIVYFLLLIITLIIYSVTFGRTVNIKRLITGALTGDIISFAGIYLSLIKNSFFVSIVSYVFCIVTVYIICFGFEGMKKCVRGSLFLLLAGILEFGVYITVGGILEGVTDKEIMLCCINILLQIMMLAVFCRAIKASREADERAEVFIKHDADNEILLKGIIDSGNMLRTPDGLNAVSIIDKSLENKIKDVIYDCFQVRVCTVSGEKLLMGGYMDNVDISLNEREKIHYEKIAIAFSDIPGKSGYEVIIPKQLLKEI